MPRNPHNPLTTTVELTVTLLDPAEWTMAFGVEGRREIRQDVQDYVLNEVQQAGVFGSREVQAEIGPKRSRN